MAQMIMAKKVNLSSFKFHRNAENERKCDDSHETCESESARM